jgi:hypothetical protein
MKSRHTSLRRRAALAGVALAALAPFAAVPGAGASETATTTATAAAQRSLEREGRCRRGPATWELKVKTVLRGRLRIDFRVEDVRPRQRWQVYVARNGRRLAAVTRRSTASGNFEVRRRARNLRGRDRVRASAVNPRTGVVCSARMRF